METEFKNKIADNLQNLNRTSVQMFKLLCKLCYEHGYFSR